MTEFWWIGFLIYFFFWAITYSKIEIAIEGKFGFGEKLPCKKWKLKGILNKITGERPYFSEYHLWMIIFLFTTFHFPHWFSSWEAWKLELFLIGAFFLFLILEDFFWFVLNPDYGLKKFKSKYVKWHPKWIGRVPDFYWYFPPLGIGLIVLSQIL